jgi:hypothetical protein
MPTCLRRLPWSHNFLKQLAPSPFLLQVRFNSSTLPRSPVIRNGPTDRRLRKTGADWTFLHDGAPTSPPAPPEVSFEEDQHSTSFEEDQLPTYSEEKEPITPSHVYRMKNQDKTGPKIIYNSKESRLRYILIQTRNVLNESRSPTKYVAVYFVGGWVRDKLMDKESSNIDVVVENITPSEFVQAMIDIQEMDSHSPRLVLKAICKYAIPNNMEKIETARDLTVGSYKFEYDAGKGKLFEVAGIYFFNLTMKMEFAALKGASEGVQKLQEDAMQRDLTMNAMYHTMNRRILDLTESGLDDLQEGRLRCPKGKQTLLDDPLRVFRIIRLASRYHPDGFTIEENTLAAMTDPEVKVRPPLIVFDSSTLWQLVFHHAGFKES